MSLYPDYKPKGARKDWEHVSIERTGAGRVARKYGTPEDWGDPTEAVGWFAQNGDGDLRIMVADFSNGKRMLLRVRMGGWSASFEQVSA